MKRSVEGEDFTLNLYCKGEVYYSLLIIFSAYDSKKSLIYKKQSTKNKMNKDNFFVASKSKWYACNRVPARKPDFVSGHGESQSEYWYTPKGVYRRSNHWSKIRSSFPVNPSAAIECGRVRFCWWVLDARPANLKIEKRGEAIGYCPWKNFNINRSGYEKYLQSSWYRELKIEY